MGKRLSVIIPGYNTSAAWWLRCVDSVRKACGPNDEIICVDDGSREPVRMEWVRADIDSRVRLLHKKNGGLAAARNFGMEAAIGRYVTFVDSDDEVLPDVYTRVIARMSTSESSVGVFGVRTIWVNEGLTKTDTPENRDYGVLSPLDVFDMSCRCLFNYAWNKVYDTHSIGIMKYAWTLRFDLDGMPNEDVMFNLEGVIAGVTWCSVNCCGYIYYRDGLTLLSRYKKSNRQGYVNCAKVWQRYGDMLKTDCTCRMPQKVMDWIDRQSKMPKERLCELEWKNIWMPESPYSLLGRWKWLSDMTTMLFCKRLCKYAKTFVYTFLRRHFYFRFVRRWNIKRVCPTAVNWTK